MLSEDYKKWQLGKLGQDFVSRGFSQGKANFAMLFDEVIQDTGLSNQAIENTFIQLANNKMKQDELDDKAK